MDIKWNRTSTGYQAQVGGKVVELRKATGGSGFNLFIDGVYQQAHFDLLKWGKGRYRPRPVRLTTNHQHKEHIMAEPTEDQKHILRQITYTAETLRNELEKAQERLVQGLKAMDDGQHPRGTFGPLGRQVPFNIARYTQKLTDLTETAFAAGLSQDQVARAYQAGSRGYSAYLASLEKE